MSTSKQQESPQAEESASLDSQSSAAIKQLRETAKWLVGIFGAVAGALIGSLSIADLGDIEGGARAAAVVGFCLAVLGVLLVVSGVATVLTPHETSFNDIPERGTSSGRQERFLSSRPGLAQGFESIWAIKDSHKSASHARVIAYRELLAIVAVEDGSDPKRNDEFLQAQRRYEQAAGELELLEPVVSDVVAALAFEKSRRRFVNAIRWALIPGALIATFGGLLFAMQDSSETSDALRAEPAKPTRVTVMFAASQRSEYAAILGPECDLKGVGAMVLASSPESREVVITDPACESLRLTLDRADAHVVASDVACHANDATKAAVDAEPDEDAAVSC